MEETRSNGLFRAPAKNELKTYRCLTRTQTGDELHIISDISAAELPFNLRKER
jgi:hypothetical protein